MYKYSFSKNLLKTLQKISKKDIGAYSNITKKIKEICSSQDINRYKNLKKPLENYKRVHVNTHFVLLFRIEGNVIIFEDYDHHDIIYTKKK